MGVRVRFSSAVLLLSVVVLAAGFALAAEDPELKQCKHQCKHQRQYDEHQREECIQKCKDYYREKKEREQRERERERGREDDEWSINLSVDPDKKLRQCQEQCEKQEGGQQRALCRLQCQQKHGRKEEEEEYSSRKEEEEEEEEEEEREGKNPYVFEDKHLSSRVKTEHGRIDVLQKFTKKSKLLRGIENYRVAFLEANPLTFVSPSHWDADGVLFVAKGRGTITTIREGKRESFNIEYGDVIRVHAGTPFYLINRDENKKLVLVKLLQPVNLPGKYEAFYAAGGEDQESFFRAFSPELLEAALKTERGRFERIFKQKREVIVKASKEQIKAMSQHEEGGGVWPFGGDTSGPFKLLHKRPVRCNNHGQLFEARPNDHRQLQDLDLAVSFTNITRGSMVGPYYNSKSTQICIVDDGEGYFEMACPHLSYKQVRARLSRGLVFVVPAGHPVASAASQNNNLKILCFEVNAQGNTRYALAGKKNVINEMENEAKELAFGVPAREVDQVFRSQNEEFFFPGPSRQPRRGRADA